MKASVFSAICVQCRTTQDALKKHCPGRWCHGSPKSWPHARQGAPVIGGSRIARSRLPDRRCKDSIWGELDARWRGDAGSASLS